MNPDIGPNDCMHQALRIEPDRFTCSKCGLTYERKSVGEHLADMRAALHSPTKRLRVQIGPARIDGAIADIPRIPRIFALPPVPEEEPDDD